MLPSWTQTCLIVFDKPSTSSVAFTALLALVRLSVSIAQKSHRPSIAHCPLKHGGCVTLPHWGYDVIGMMRVRLSDARSSLSLSYLPYNVRLVFKTVEAIKCFDGVGTCNSFSKGLNQIKWSLTWCSLWLEKSDKSKNQIASTRWCSAPVHSSD